MRVLFLIPCLMLCGCVTQPKALKPTVTRLKHAKNVEIFVVSHGKHTGLILDAQSVEQGLPDTQQRFGQPRYYEIGWGDAGFYQAPKITSGLAVSAVFWPTPTVLHVVALDEHPRDAFPMSEVISIRITDPDRRQLLKFIDSSFARASDGAVRCIGPGLYGNSAFYEAVGQYYLLNTCNKWTAKGLYSAGLPVDALTPMSSEDVMKQIRQP